VACAALEVAPRSVVPQSIMPNYPWLLETELDYSDVASRMRALRATGVPYSLTQQEYDANVKKFGKPRWPISWISASAGQPDETGA
jgi:cbb3-type cytochrome oxidase cytochrome c subunit